MTAYDACYVAVAEAFDCRWRPWTSDWPERRDRAVSSSSPAEPRPSDTQWLGGHSVS